MRKYVLKSVNIYHTWAINSKIKFLYFYEYEYYEWKNGLF